MRMDEQQVDKMVAFARDVLGLEMDDWQVEAMRVMEMRDIKHPKRVSVEVKVKGEMAYIPMEVTMNEKGFLEWWDGKRG